MCFIAPIQSYVLPDILNTSVGLTHYLKLSSLMSTLLLDLSLTKSLDTFMNFLKI